MFLIKNIYLIFLVLHFTSVNCGHILFVSMPDGRSHISSMLPLAHRLQESYGHNVSVFYEFHDKPRISLDGGIKSELLQWKNISQSILDHFELDDPYIQNLIWTQDMRAIAYPIMWAASSASATHLLEHQRNDLEKIVNKTWDLIILDHLFSVAGISLVKMTKSPYIHYFTAMPHPLYVYYKGLSRPMSAAPTTAPLTRHDTSFWNVSSLMDRIRVFEDSFSFMFVYRIIVELMIRRTLKSVDPNFTFSQLYGDDLLAVYGYFDRLDFPMPISNHFLSAGVGVSCANTKPLPADLELFINDPKSLGTIVMTFGTKIRWDMAPQVVKDAWIEILSELKEFRIVWAIRYLEEGQKTIGHRLPPHVLLTGWLPQTDILAHNSTKLFITHGGLKSLKEAICAELPALFMALFAEQQRNAFLAKTFGFGEYVNKRDIKPKEVVKLIKEMIYLPIYSTKVKRMKSLWLDRVIPALDEAAFKINKIITHKGLPKKYCYINFEASWLRYLFLDGFILVFAAVILFVI